MIVSLVAEVADRYRSALAKLAGAGVRIAGTRLERYMLTLEELGSVDHQTLNRMPGSLDRLALCLLEATQILDIADLNLSDFRDPLVLHHLREISSGSEYIGAEVSHDPGRDFAFEFTAAAQFQRWNMFGGFSPLGGDLMLAVGNCLRPAECKRLSSESALSGRLAKARRRNRRDYARLPSGLILVDISRSVGMSLKNWPSATTFVAMAQRKMNRFIERNLHVIQTSGRRYASTLGCAFRYMASGFVGGYENIRRCTIWSFVQMHDTGTPEAEIFPDLVKSVDDRPTILMEESMPKSLGFVISVLASGKSWGLPGIHPGSLVTAALPALALGLLPHKIRL